jgi:hypothetical protein
MFSCLFVQILLLLGFLEQFLIELLHHVGPSSADCHILELMIEYFIPLSELTQSWLLLSCSLTDLCLLKLSHGMLRCSLSLYSVTDVYSRGCWLHSLQTLTLLSLLFLFFLRFEGCYDLFFLNLSGLLLLIAWEFDFNLVELLWLIRFSLLSFLLTTT